MSIMAETTRAGAKQANAALRRAAVVLSMVGSEHAAEICRQVDPVTAHRLIQEVAALGTVGQEERVDVARDLVSRTGAGGTSTAALASELKEQVLGLRGSLDAATGGDAEMSLERLALLDKADPAVIWRALSSETPQAIALVVKYLSPVNVARLLSAMPDDVRAEVAFRMASQRPPTPGAIKAFGLASDRLLKFAAAGGDSSEGHLQFVVDVVSQLNRSISQQVIGAIKERAPELGDTIEQKIFSLTDILRLPGPSLQIILRNTATNDLALALKGVDEDLKESVFTNLSQRARAVLEEEISLLGPVPASEAERAQNEIVQVARTLDSTGEISLQAGDVEYVE